MYEVHRQFVRELKVQITHIVRYYVQSTKYTDSSLQSKKYEVHRQFFTKHKAQITHKVRYRVQSTKNTNSLLQSTHRVKWKYRHSTVIIYSVHSTVHIVHYKK